MFRAQKLKYFILGLTLPLLFLFILSHSESLTMSLSQALNSPNTEQQQEQKNDMNEFDSDLIDVEFIPPTEPFRKRLRKPDEDWVKDTCLINKNDCVRENPADANSPCICPYPECRRNDEAGSCKGNEVEPFSCEPDECGIIWVGKVQVFVSKPKTNATVYSSRLGDTPSLNFDGITKFLSQYPLGKSFDCWYDNAPGVVIEAFLDSHHICSDRGTWDDAEKKCSCSPGWLGQWCDKQLEFKTGEQPNGDFIRPYYIACEEVDWDYAPWDIDIMTMLPLNQTTRPGHSPKIWTGHYSATDQDSNYLSNRIGKVYKKARYVRYYSSKFETVVQQPEHLGLLGPPIRARVGDILKITFFNNCSYDYSMHPHGVFYDKASEGAAYSQTAQTVGGGVRVLPGDTYTYTWHVPERAGPGPNDPSSVAWFYHSHVDESEDVNAGLVGPLIISAGESSRDRLSAVPEDVDVELFAYFSIFDESRSWYLEENLLRYWQLNADQLKEFRLDPAFRQSSSKFTINGRLYGNLDGFTMKQGDRVRWYVMALGTADMLKTDLHGIHWHGNTVLWKGNRVDSIPLMPAISLVADMYVDSDPGEWFFHCHTNHHMHAGMMALYQVAKCEDCLTGEGSHEDDSHSTTGAILLTLFLFFLIVCFAIGAWTAFSMWKPRRSTEDFHIPLEMNTLDDNDETDDHNNRLPPKTVDLEEE